MSTAPVVTPQQRQLAIRAAMRELIAGKLAIGIEALAERIHCKPAEFYHIANGEAELRWGKAWLLWRDFNVSPAWIAGDSTELYLPMRAFGFTSWALDADRPFVEFYEAHLAAAFANVGKTGVCTFALFEAMDRAKAAFASGTMTPEQSRNLRAAVEAFK